MPAKIVQVTDIPRTKSGKIVELAVRNVVHGRDVRNIEALANPEALEQYRDRPSSRASEGNLNPKPDHEDTKAEIRATELRRL